jgi:anhydro-N-acetylmuramic acid kinase
MVHLIYIRAQAIVRRGAKVKGKLAEPVWALGAMSGTSLDGVDAALIRTDGRRIFEFGESAYRG